MVNDLPPSIAFMLGEFQGDRLSMTEVRRRLDDKFFVKDYFDQCSASIATYEYADQRQARPDKFDIYAGAGLDPLHFGGKNTELRCVINSAHLFARTACLYADRVVIPDPFSFTYIEATDEDIFLSLQVLKVLKPLIEAGIIIFGPAGYVAHPNCVKVRKEAEKQVAKQLLNQFMHTTPDVFRYKDGQQWRVSFGSSLFSGQRISFTATKEAITATKPNTLLTDKAALTLMKQYREAFQRHFAYCANSVVFASLFGSRCNTTVVTNTPEEAIGYRLLDHRKVSIAPSEWSMLRTVKLPALQSLTASQAMQVREEAEKALPAFRTKLQLDLMSLKDLSDEAEEKRALEIATELRLAARDLEGQLASISLPSLRRKEKLFVGLTSALEIVALGSGNLAAILAASSMFAATMIAAHQTQRDRQEKHELLVHQPAYVLLTAEHIHKVSR
jgi:hypothetical protein